MENILPGVKSVVTCAEQQITARNPLLVLSEILVWNLTVMVPLLVKGPGLYHPENLSTDEPSSIST